MRDASWVFGGGRQSEVNPIHFLLGRVQCRQKMVIGKSRIWPDGVAVIAVVIIAVMFARANAPSTSSSASSNINRNGELRQWQTTGFLKGMEL